MINELIEKEIEKLRKEGEEVSFDWSNAGGDWNLEALFEESLQTIAKEVAMRFKEHNYGSYYINKDKIELFADQIINEVSE